MLRPRLSILLASALLATPAVGVLRDAHACAVLTPDESVPVTGHRMILSVSNDRTTLWDQFVFTGEPDQFAWILPIKGQVSVGISSDALFNALGQVTAPEVFAPSVCPNSCLGQGGGNDGGGGVEVIAEEVVGPYESVQLSSSDPNALYDWLTSHGFPIPATVQPVLAAYVDEGFDFLALRLLPDQGTDSVTPVRVTMQGAAPSVPIRLLAAGTGDITQVTLWILSDGKILPTNAPTVTIDDSDLTWDVATDSSDYAAVRTAKLESTNNLGYLIEQSHTYEHWEIANPLTDYVESSPAESGYGDTLAEAQEALAADLDALYGSLPESVWVTRLSADLSREALETDLSLGAAANQTALYGSYNPTAFINQGECPPDPCAQGGGGSGSGASGGSGGNGDGGSGTGNDGTGASGNAGGVGGNDGGAGGGGSNADPDGGTGDCGCALPGTPVSGGFVTSLLFATAMLLRARRRRGS